MLLLLVVVTPGIQPVHAQDQWYGYNQPYGGPVNFIRMWGDTGIAASVAAYQTTDGGVTWRETIGFSPSSVAIDTGGIAFMSFQHLPSWSSDYGKTWLDYPTNSPVYTNIEQFLTAPGGKHFAVRATTPWVSSPHVILKSVNPAYNTWVVKQSSGLPASFTFNELDVNKKTGSLFLSTVDSTGKATTMYRSSDDGDHWELLPLTGIPTTDSMIWGFNTLNALNNGTLFYASHHIEANVWVWNNYRSTDDGTTWHSCGAGLPPYTALWSMVQNAAGTIFATTLLESDGATSQWTSVYQSTDDGMNWTEPANAGLPPQWASQVAITGNGALLAHAIVSHGGGVYRSTDNGASWNLSVQGLFGVWAAGIAADSDGHLYSSIPESGLYGSITGFTWTRQTTGVPTWGYMNLRSAPDRSIYAADTINGVFHSTNHGATWTSVASNLPSLHMRTFDISPPGTLLAYTDKGVYRSTNTGTDWVIASGTIPQGVQVKHSAVRADGLIVATSNNGPYISEDDGEHWTLATTGLAVPSCDGVGFTKDGTILLGNGGGVARSSDNGAQWERSDVGLVQDSINHNDFNAFAVRKSGRIVGARPAQTFAYASTDNGRTWTDGRTGNFANFVFLLISAFATDNKNNLYAATDFGLWHATPEPVDVKEDASMIPNQMLVTATPNPMTSSTMIEFTMPRAGAATITIVDNLGRDVLRSEPVHVEAGACSVPVNTSMLPAGTYHCIVRGSATSGTAEMSVVR